MRSDEGTGCCDGVQVSKRGLMGFCDPAPDEEKHLRVRFLWHGRPHVATLADKVRYGPAGQLNHPCFALMGPK